MTCNRAAILFAIVLAGLIDISKGRIIELQYLILNKRDIAGKVYTKIFCDGLIPGSGKLLPRILNIDQVLQLIDIANRIEAHCPERLAIKISGFKMQVALKCLQY